MEQGSYDEHGHYVSTSVKVHKVYMLLLNMEDIYSRKILMGAVKRYITYVSEDEENTTDNQLNLNIGDK